MLYLLYLFQSVEVAITKYHRLGATETYFSQFWRLEVISGGPAWSGSRDLSSRLQTANSLLDPLLAGKREL